MSVVPSSLQSRLQKLADRLGRPVESLVEEALGRYLEEHEADVEPEPEPGFDEVVFGQGDAAQTFTATDFRALPLRRQVRMLMMQTPRFFRGGEEIPREQALSLAGAS